MPTADPVFSLLTLLVGVEAEEGELRAARSRVSPLSSLCLLKPPAEMRRSAFSTSMPTSDPSPRVAKESLAAGEDLTVALSSPALTGDRQAAILALRCLAGGELWAEAEASCVLMEPQVVVITLLLSVLHSTPITAASWRAGVTAVASTGTSGCLLSHSSTSHDPHT